MRVASRLSFELRRAGFLSPRDVAPTEREPSKVSVTDDSPAAPFVKASYAALCYKTRKSGCQQIARRLVDHIPNDLELCIHQIIIGRWMILELISRTYSGVLTDPPVIAEVECSDV